MEVPRPLRKFKVVPSADKVLYTAFWRLKMCSCGPCHRAPFAPACVGTIRHRVPPPVAKDKTKWIVNPFVLHNDKVSSNRAGLVHGRKNMAFLLASPLFPRLGPQRLFQTVWGLIFPQVQRFASWRKIPKSFGSGISRLCKCFRRVLGKTLKSGWSLEAKIFYTFR